jgi:hypothetical protein
MDIQPPPDDPLHALFSGKRRWIRMPGEHPVELRGRKSGFTGRILDLSRGGLRVAVKDPLFYEGGENGLALVLRRFPRGATIRFVDEGIARRVRIVRITPHQGMWLSLGCEFEKALTGGEAVRLGVASESFDGEGSPRLIEIACSD